MPRQSTTPATPRTDRRRTTVTTPPLRVRDFLALVERAATPDLPAHARTRIAYSFVQVIFDDPRVHYECWVQRKAAAMEIGLHFEGVRDFSYAWAGLFADRMADVHACLGPKPTLEEWAASWARLHERWDAPSLDEPFAERAAARLAAYAAALQPIVEELRPLVADSAKVLAAGRTHRMDEVPPDFRP